MADETTESLAGDLAEQIYERWCNSICLRGVSESDTDHACLEALVTLIDGLRMSELDPQTGALQLRAAIEALAVMPDYPAREEFQRQLVARTSGESARCARRTVTQG